MKRRSAAPWSTWFEHWPSGAILTLIVAANQALMLAVFPVVPNNDTVSYVEFGHMSAAKRPVDHYAPPRQIPSVAEIPKVEGWRRQQQPSYGYPWMFLDLPAGWATDWSWVTRATRPPLVTGRLVPQNREWDNAFPVGASLYWDLLFLLFPAHARGFAFVLMSHLYVLAVSVLLWRIGMQLGRARGGWVAGLTYGLLFAPGARAQELMNEPLFILLDLGALYFVIKGCRWNRAGAIAVGGILLGFACAVRPVGLLQPAVLAAVLLFTTASWRDWLKKNAACGVPFALICALVLCHNWLFFGRLAYSTGLGRHLFNRVVTIERRLDSADPSTRMVLDLARRPRSGGDQPHPYQSGSLNVFSDGSCWSLYWMLRWQGLSVQEADGKLADAAFAVIRSDVAGYVLRSLQDVWVLGHHRGAYYVDRLADPRVYVRYITEWFIPQFRLAPYNWIESQWRVFKKEVPLYGPPKILGVGLRRALIGGWVSLPAPSGLGVLLILFGAAFAAARARREWWLLPVGWYVALLIVPALLQTPNPRYAEPALPIGLLLMVYGAGNVFELVRRGFSTLWA